MKNTACRDALSGLHVPRPRAPCWPLLLPLHQATTRCGTVGLPVHLPDSARVTGNRKLGFVGKRLNFRVADDTPKTFLDFQQLVCGARGVAPREALLSSQLPHFAVEFISSATSAPEHLPSRQRITGTITQGGICMPVRSRTPVFGSGHRYTDESGPRR